MKTHCKLLIVFFLIVCSLSGNSQTVFRGTVVDANTKQPIVHARVGISDQGVGELTNEKGFFTYRRYEEVLQSESKLIVGANGYEPIALDAGKVRELLNTSSKIELLPTGKKESTPEIKTITVFWDVSEDMQGRNIETELAHLQKHVSQYEKVTVRLVAFGYEIRKDEHIEIVGGDMSRFRESVSALIYNGPSNYDILDITGADAVILSSNGNPNYGNFRVSQDIPVFAITSQDIGVEEVYMNALANYTQGVYIPLDNRKITSPQRSVSKQSNNAPMVRGKITSLGEPLQEVSIVKKGDFTEYFTKADGSFELPGEEGDILQIRYLGMFPKVILVENINDIKVELLPKNDMLDEIVLTRKYEKIIVGDKTIRGTNEPHIPGGITRLGDFYITYKDITPNGKTLEMVLREKFSGVAISYTPRGEVVTIFGKRPLWIVNGFSLQQGEPVPLYIPDSDIASIIVKDSDMTNIKYGGQGQRGLQVLVTTKTGREEFKNGKEYLAKNNNFDETLPDINPNSIIAGKTQVTGKIISLGKPLQEVSIIKKGDFTEYLTKADGSFELPGQEGDILQIRYLGMFPKDVLVSDQEAIVVELLPENDVLDEVVIEKKIERIIVGNKEIRGRKVSPHIPGGVTSLGDFYITSDDIKPNAKSVEQVIRDHFKRIQVSHTWEGIKLSVNGVQPVFYVDNRKVLQDVALSIVDRDIESIIVKESKRVTTSRYGTDIGGVAVIITTKSSPLARVKKEKSALVKGNEYTEEVASISNGIVSSKTQITGKVTSLGKPIQGAVISKKGTFDEFISKADGSFIANVSEGDILAVNYLGMYTKLILISDEIKDIEVDLLPKNDVLDEVELSGNARKRSEKEEGADLETGRYKRKFLGSFNVQTLTRENANIEGWANVAFGLAGKFSSVDVNTKPGEESITIRNDGVTYFINGTPVDKIQFFSINPTNIATVSVKKSLVGIIGRAIFIDTIDFTSINKPVPSALVKGNDYEENIATIDNQITSSSKTIKGKITSLGKPIQGATITKQGTFEEYTSKSDGTFELPANERDLFAVHYLGMYPKGFMITDQKEYTINLTPKNDVLDEVVLNGENKSEELKKIEAIDEEYKRKSYTPRVLTQDEIAKSNTHNIIDLISGRFSGTATKGVYPNQVIVNPRSALNAPFGVLLDGVLYEQEILDFISISTIVKLEVINSAFSSASGQGSGGVIKITTIATSPNTILKKEIPSALVEGNEYTEEIKSINEPVVRSSKTMITGVVRDSKGFLNDATITRKGSFDEVYSNAQGGFTIKAAIDDVLVISKVGMFTKEVLIESQDIGVIELTPKNDELDEVVLSGDSRIDNTIETSDGRRVSKDKLGYAIDELTSDSFSAGATTLRDLIVGKVSGVSVEGAGFSGSEVVYKIRGGNQSVTNNIPPIWIVNGTPYQDPPEFLDIQQIASISVLKSVIATSRYGTLAAGGAFLIKTKELSFKDKAKEVQKSALVNGNDYNESSTRTIDTSTLPEYILRLREISNLQERFETYQRISRTQESPLEFYVDVAQYFDGINKKMANQVRADLAYISRNNTKALRTLCYIYEAAGDYKKAALIYERIVKIAPSEAQSYRDLALVYQEVGKYNQALELYYNMLGEQIKGVSFKGLEKLLKNELSHLLALHKDKVDYKRFPNEWLRADFDIDIRMVIDWSDRSVPFEFQFVNPDKKFFKWTHTLEESRERLEEEQALGYQAEEFIIDDAPQGEWLINIQYLGDEGDYVLPPFLKYTVYRNYGTPQETKEIKVVKLFKQSDKVTLGKVVL